MNYVSKFLFFAAAGCVASLSSCNKLVNDYDVNPNAPTDAPADLRLTGVEVAHGFVMSGEAARTANIWAGVFTGEDRQYSALQAYQVGLADFDNMWTNSYYATIQQARLTQQKAQAIKNFQLVGIAQVVEAQMVGTVTALWGNVPYSQALVELTPGKFDTQAEVYVAVQALLTQAIANLGRTGVSPQGRDIYYGGDLSKWTAAAHSLKARYFLHMAGGLATSPFYAQAIAEAQLGIAAPGGDMLMPYTGVIGSSANPYYDFIDNSRSGYMSANGSYAATLLLNRVPDTGGLTQDSARYRYFFDDRGTASNYFDRDPNFVDGAFTPASAFPLVSFVETKAILAEAQARNGSAADALTALNAIRAANANTYASGGGRYTPYTPANFQTGGVLNAGGGQTAAQALLKEILVEKYVSLVGQIEEFNDVRRTKNLIGVPKNVASAPSLPQRFLYPQVEANTNPNTPAQISTSIFIKTPVNNN